MKIKSSITKKVTDTLAGTKKVLSEAIIGLLVQAGVESGEGFTLSYPVSLTSSKRTKDGHIISETNIINSVAYCTNTGRNGDGSFILGEYNGKSIVSDWFMNVGQLIALYEVVKDSVKDLEKEG